MELMEDAAEEYPQLLPDFAHKEVEVASTIHRRQERRTYQTSPTEDR
jgi:hypothetical protein